MRITKKHTLYSLRKRILALILLISFVFIVLIVRLSVVSLINGKWLQARALSQWTRDLPMTAERGKIYDCYGSTLAVSYTTYDVYIRPREIKDSVQIASTLASIMDADFETVLAKVQLSGVSEVLVKSQLSENIASNITMKKLKGVYVSENVKRYYPYGDLLTQILGFTTIDNIGQAGVEAYYDNMLKGLNGQYLVQSDLTGKKIENTLETYVPSVAGMNVSLTIDANIQLIVEQTLGKIMTEQKAKSASAILMNAKTGELVALSTKPSFNLNEVPRDDVNALMSTVKNKTVVDVYEPGSTFKILTTASALEEGKTSVNDRFYDPGYRIVDGQKIKCWKTTGHGSQNLVDGICNSCNSVFMDLALRMGKDTFYKYLKNFGIGTKTNIDISGESSGILMNQSVVKNVDLARIGFGQAVAVTPLQLITAFCACVNGGNLMKPYLVKQITSPSGEIISKYEPTIVRKVVSESTSKTMNTLLEAVTTKQGKASFVAGYNIGGKTGTAQKYENGAIARGKYVSSFFGTYPADNPDYALLILVDEPGAGAYYGSVVAAPYAKDIFSSLFEKKNIAPTKNVEQDMELMKQTIEMPDIVGMSLAKACGLVTSLGLLYELDGEGSVVCAQYPPAGSMLYQNQTIIIKTC